MTTLSEISTFKQDKDFERGIPFDPSTDVQVDVPKDLIETFVDSITFDSVEEPPQELEGFMLGTLGHRRLRVHMPFTVKLDTENEDHIAEVEEINEFGFGKSIWEAVADLQQAIVDLYFTLEEDQDRLGPDLSSVWRTLQEMVNRVG